MSINEFITEFKNILNEDMFKPASKEEVTARAEKGWGLLTPADRLNTIGDAEEWLSGHEEESSHTTDELTLMDQLESGMVAGYISSNIPMNVRRQIVANVLDRLEAAKEEARNESVNEEDFDPTGMMAPASSEEVAKRLEDLRDKERQDLIQSIVKISKTNKDGSLTVMGDVKLRYNRIESLKNLGIAIDTVTGDFDCSNCALTDLEGAPRVVRGSFYAVDNNLVSLAGGPVYVYKNYAVSRCRLLSIDGIAKYIGGTLNLTRNQDLRDFSPLKDIEVKGYIRVNRNSEFNLKDFDYMNLRTRKGINLETGLTEAFQSNIIRFLRSAIDSTELGYLANIKWDQITDEDVKVSNNPSLVYKNFKAGDYDDKVLIFLLTDLDDDKLNKMYVQQQDLKFHVPHIMFFLNSRVGDIEANVSSFFKGSLPTRASLSDMVIIIPKDKFSSSELKAQRRTAQANSPIRLRDADIRSANQKRYAKILTAKREDVDFADISKQLLDYTNSVLFNMKSGKEDINSYKVMNSDSWSSDDPRKRIGDFLKEVWDKIDSGFNYISNLAKDPNDEYYAKEVEQIKSSFVSALSALKDKRIDFRTIT